MIGSILPVIYGNGSRITQSPGYVTITYEMIHDTRVIPLDGRPHLSPRIRQYLGDARGRFEGDTLVIETTNFTDQTSIGGNGNGQRHSDALKLTERITRLDAQTVGHRDVTTYESCHDASIHDRARQWCCRMSATRATHAAQYAQRERAEIARSRRRRESLPPASRCRNLNAVRPRR